MYTVKNLHLEPTTACNASCPQCPRNVYGSKHNPSGFIHSRFNTALLDNMDVEFESVLVNGNYGDFVMLAGGAVGLVRDIRKRWPSANIQVNTNGSALHRREWELLGEWGITVEFGIDGIDQATHEIYRRGTLLNRVLENAQHFIDAGGTAHWAMTLFDHNKDEVEDAKVMSNQMGFKKFTARPSTRFNNGNPTPILNDDFTVSDWLWPHDNANWTFDTNRKEIKIPKKFARAHEKNMIVVRDILADRVSDNVTCWADEHDSIYVDASGRVYPCCWMGRHDLWDNVCKELGVWPEFNQLDRGLPLSFILKDEFWEVLNKSIEEKNPVKPCSLACGKCSSFNEQMDKSEVYLNDKD